MNYVKKMCILRQVKQGFSGDGKALSGLVKIEQYGKNLAVEVSIINFAPLVSGEYYCLLSDGKGKTEMLALRGKSLFNILSDLDITHGFCAVICYVKGDLVPIAYGINGNGSYDWRAILNATLPPVFPDSPHKTAPTEIAQAQVKTREEEEKQPTQKMQVPPDRLYDDETLATENYYNEEEKENGQELFEETFENAHSQSRTQKQNEKERPHSTTHGDVDDVLHPFETNSDGYYKTVKQEIDELLNKYPRDDTLVDAFSSSEWVRVKGEKHAPEYLVGVLYRDGKADYICYALAAEDRNNPPEEIKDVCVFVPVSPYFPERGFFVIFQSAATGECVKPERV